ncbi:type I restriction endonuclease subunit R [Capnocytophaga sp.]|uniref:type I restriction endonuclease subunit R n=1 Tax=Capnocytophaga sp. TaxID=44737 RepID=UPI0026DC2002|nr:type I restriction endonuclease subunit R [Capnocytophaga sp.]MDO5106064.1 type I restriction endonuclease subunit R [Capnocytophaga sp.]
MSSQPEYILEEKLIEQLQNLGYKKVSIRNEEELLKNLKNQLEKHNKTSFSEREFDRILNYLSTGSIFEKAKKLRGYFRVEKDNGTSEYISFINKEFWCQNQFQVAHQITIEGVYKNRYDVTLLINGLPLVQIELKRIGMELQEAFRQINRYQKQSYSSGAALFNYVQIFVISNNVNTKYYSNNSKQNFKQTFYWSDEQNNTIQALDKFTYEFLEPCHLAKMITKYIVLNETHKVLMVLRPYQYYAVERIVERVKNSPKNGFVWHTTGSGKTLTSFKASQILKELPDVEKVVFVVDRKDLDTQTQKEFDSFEKGSVDSTENTAHLVRQLSDDTKLIVTTLQKLNTAITKEKHDKKIKHLQNKKVVFIFDECHRSQFGETHQNIRKYFNKAQMIGFTGTPISGTNSVGKIDGQDATTNRLFDDCLHKYVITDAIRDENVLKFSVEYVGRYKEKEKSNNYIDIEVNGIDTQELLESDDRLNKITDFIISEYGRKTNGKVFNAMFCVSRIGVLQKYYDLFQAKKEAGKHNLKVAAIFSYGANNLIDEEDDTEGNTTFEREVLERYIGHFNEMFGTNHSTKDNKGFYNYHKDVAEKIRKRELDLIIVVNMFLTGFDSPKLNTLFVDKNLNYHGLIQAFSRTNRLFDDRKSQGNIVCFRNLKAETDAAVALFSDKDAIKKIIIQPIEDYIELFNEALKTLKIIAPELESVDNYQTEEQKLEFIKAFRDLMRLLNVLKSFSDFSYDALEMSEYEFDGYKSKYLDIWSHLKTQKIEGKESILEDVDFELELIHRDEINVAYILSLLSNLQKNNLKEEERQKKQKEIYDLLSSDVQLRSKRELIEKFINENLPFISEEVSVSEAFEEFWNEEKKLAIGKIIEEEVLDSDKFQNTLGEYIFSAKLPKQTEILNIRTTPPKISERTSTAQRITQKIKDFVTTFIDGMGE